ncbi:MAG: primosomal protein N' [Chloroflexi bacterium]|nr:primosomal protein N' [Chloroflexota bacterium]
MPGVNRIVEVAPLTDAVVGTLSYSVPEQYLHAISAGIVVIVPLRNRLTAGIVVRCVDESDAGAAGVTGAVARDYIVKPIHSLLDEKAALNAQQLELARWMSAEYRAPLGRCCALMIPPGYTPTSAYLYTLAAEQTAPLPVTTDVRSRIIAILQQRGSLTEGKLKLALRGAKGWRRDLKRLVDEGFIARSSTLEPVKVKPRRTTMVQLVISDPTLEIVLENLLRSPDNKRQPSSALQRRMAVLSVLREHDRLAWAEWVMAETGATRADLDWLAQRDYIVLGDAERWRDPLADIDYAVTSEPSLTGDQARAWEEVSAAMNMRLDETSISVAAADNTPARRGNGNKAARDQFLLRGVTGSGKTEVYMRAVDRVLRQGRGALILVPEISLTPQTARRFLSRFPGKVALIHSRLKPGERYDTWRRIRAGALPVVVGARSALFAPLPQVGIIVLDEEHDQSYKQNSSPYYDARRVAKQYAALSGASLIYGSATPSLEAWHMAEEGELRVLELPNRVRGHASRIADQEARMGVHSTAKRETDTVLYQPMPDVQIIDMRAELRGGNLSMFSGALSTALTETLARGEQAIIFLNRRGSASCVICRDCGHVLRCPNDDMPLTYHQPMAEGEPAARRRPPASSMKCHLCNHVEEVPVRCPACGNARIRFIGIGTQKVEQAIHEQFPRARVVRWDKDTSSGAGRTSADQMLQRFVHQQADVLVGTQMIAKGLDLPLVTLVGVVLADVGLFLPDFRAAERVFDLIEQVAGRAGRSLLAGRVIVQTYNPEHPAIDFAATHSVSGFARYELAQRKMLRLPPYVRLVRFEVDDEDMAQARLKCEMLARQLRRRVPQLSDVIGPSSAYFARRNNRHRWQVFVRTLSPRALLEDLEIPREFIVDVDPMTML